MNTLYLNPYPWDLALDANGNIALATEPYSLAQDASSNIRTFAGEVYYDTTLGLPYFTAILGQGVPLELIRSRYTLAALAVPDVASVQVFFTSFTNRALLGQVQITDVNGLLSVASFNTQPQPNGSTVVSSYLVTETGAEITTLSYNPFVTS